MLDRNINQGKNMNGLFVVETSLTFNFFFAKKKEKMFLPFDAGQRQLIMICQSMGHK